MAGLLDQTRESWLRGSFEWGSTDCALSVLEYVCKARNVQPATLPLHNSQKDAERLLLESGGLLLCVSAVANRLGLRQTPSPRSGDVGVIAIPRSGLTCAILLGRQWMLRAPRGVVTTSRQPVRAWRI